MTKFGYLVLVTGAHVMLTGAGAVFAQGGTDSAPTAAEAVSEPPPEFSEAFLGNPENVEAGKALWQKQCRHCHGKSAYPGKAPKLKPRRYTPEFVYDRVTNGFRKMPAWGTVYTREERMNVVAYVMSKVFSP